MELAEIKQVKPEDLWEFLAEDHKQFSVLDASFKSIFSTKRTSITLSKNSGRSFL